MKDTVLVLGDLFNVLPDAIVVVDSGGGIVFANFGVYALLGYTVDELMGQPLMRIIPEQHRGAHDSHLAKFRKHGKPTSMGARPLLSALHKSGREIPTLISIANLDLDGERYSVAIMRDGGELHSEITEAHSRAETDALTSIGNRLRLSREIQSALTDSRPFGLLYLDLKKFKPFNDDYGHEVGDKVLKIVAQRLQAQIRSGDLAVRLGGDEFVVILDGLVAIELLEQRAARIARSLTRLFHIGDLSSVVGVSIGGAMHPRDGKTEEGLLKAADQNMYRAKQAGVDYDVGN